MQITGQFIKPLKHTFTTEQILQTEEFLDFYKAALDFCDFIENYQNKRKVDYLHTVRQNLLKLYNTALKLQWVDLQSNVEYDDKLDDKEFNNILSRIVEGVDNARYYWYIFDPTCNKDHEAVCGDLVDDLGDIYKDLKYSIMIFNLGDVDCKENALWQFKFDFDKHWGGHCINALSAIHFYLEKE